MKDKKIKLRVGAVTLLTAALLAAGAAAVPTSAATEHTEVNDIAEEGERASGTVRVTLDGREILLGEAKLINSVTYVPLRRFSELCGAGKIGWDAKTATATVKRGGITIRVRQGLPYIEAAGRYFYTDSPILNIEGRLYLPVRLMAKVFCIDVDWNAKTRTAELKSTDRTLQSSAQVYKADDVYWLSRIISAESGGEPLRGKIAVGNVVLNRKAHSAYPNTVYGVIFDRKHGTQFSPVSFGTIYKAPTEESIIAAKICLEGYSIDNNILFFMNPRIATSNWISNNRPFAFTIANHDFYY